MSRSRLIHSAVVLTAVVVWVTLPGSVRAYDNGGNHQHVCTEAEELFSFPDLVENIGMITFGAWCEDENDHVYDTSGPWVTLPHFWIADEGDNQINWWGAYGYENAWMKSRILINRARDEYVAGNHAEGYHLLGHVCHLLADMTVPAHAHYDEHADDAYENWMMGWYSNVNSSMASLWTPVPEITDGIIQQIMDSWGGISAGPIDLVAPLYFLMYTANQRADYFASDDVGGNSSDRHGWMDYTDWPASPRTTDDLVDNDENDTDEDGDLSRVAYKCYAYSISATARLYEVWRDHLDHEAPVTHLSIAGPDPVHDGWRPGNVVMSLAADDNFSGVFETRYGGGGVALLPYTEPVPIDDEGIKTFCYQSMDRFANEEELQTETIKIDRTPPVVSILCPVPDGLYLSSGSLTIDFEAGDEPSGLYDVQAELDGQPVMDGQVFDMTQMAGFHTITLIAEDMAGNTTAETVDFSIKIHATVEFTPDRLNLKSAGGTLTSFVGFPEPYDVGMIDVATVMLTADGEDVPARPDPSTLGHLGPDGRPLRSLKFDRRPICDALAGESGDVELIVSGDLSNGVEFYGTGILEIFGPGQKRSSAEGPDATTPNDGESAGNEERAPGSLALRLASCLTSQPAEIRWELPVATEVSLAVYDVQGKIVALLFEGSQNPGFYQTEWSGGGAHGERVPTGIYFIRLTAGSASVVKKIVFAR